MEMLKDLIRRRNSAPPELLCQEIRLAKSLLFTLLSYGKPSSAQWRSRTAPSHNSSVPSPLTSTPEVFAPALDSPFAPTSIEELL